ncbi:hypothetical protein PSAL_025560 [Pseudooceanicola algae]|uniref:Aminoglycoside phosphotransferase domain-containing protein n=1 Tax=Pseudooceanicola algae TaxID=1537215 RepID=A0A418SB72_9RHOB|nr:hypothetical protein PSAL_025560 [Pseudooceanicola algae]
MVKLFRPENASPVFPNDPRSEALVLEALRGSGLVPELVGITETPFGACVIYRHIDGESGNPDPCEAGRLLRHLHDVPAPAGLRTGPDGSHALRAEIRAQAQGLVTPDGQDLAQALLKRICGTDLPRSGVPALVHGDPVPGNMITGPGGLRLIDWQCPAVADPTLDLAIFLSPGMNLIYRGRPLDDTERQDFLSAYADDETNARMTGLEALYHARMAVYCLSRAYADPQPETSRDLAAARLELLALAECTGTPLLAV